LTLSDTLSSRLREATALVHRRAEQSGIMQDILHRRVSREAYLLLLRNLVPVYETLELALAAHADHPAIEPIYFRTLDRAPSLAQDLDTLYGPDWRTALPVLPSALAYAERIRTAAALSPALLAAHSYTRYLGDLSGGQILSRLVAVRLGLTNGAGTAFYQFPGISDPGVFKQGYRAALDALPLDPATSAELVAEAVRAFELNTRLFEEVGSAPAAK
jgi:heme oxygenase